MDNIYTLLNNVSTDLDNYDSCELSKPEVKRIQTHAFGQARLAWWRKILVTACIAVLMTIICIMGFKDTFYMQIKVFYSQFMGLMRSEEDLDNGSSRAGKWAKRNGFTITSDRFIWERNESLQPLPLIFDKPMVANRGYLHSTALVGNNKNREFEAWTIL